MKTNQTVTLEIPAGIFKEIRRFKKNARIRDDESAVFELVKYALSLPQYFRDFNWNKAEKEADADIKAGRVRKLSAVDDLLSDLKA